MEVWAPIAWIGVASRRIVGAPASVPYNPEDGKQ